MSQKTPIMDDNRPRIAAYCRVSTDKEEQATSLDAQQAFFRQYARNTGCELVRLYTDDGKSGTKFKNRPAFIRMMQDAQLGLFSCVYVKDVSRLSRNVVDFLQSIRSLKAMGVDCRFITANMSLSDGELTLTILAAVAQEESANLSKRVKFGKQKNAKAGKVPNFVYGYDKPPGDCFHLQINPREAAVVRQIYAWYLAGYGTYAIAERLNEQQVLTKRGYAFSANAVLRILKNRLYIGEVINAKEEVADFLTSRRKKNPPDKWLIASQKVPALLSRDTFYAVREKLSSRQVSSQPYAQHLFSGLIVCGICGTAFRRINRTPAVWVCRGRNQHGTSFCPNNTALREDDLFSYIITYLRSQIGDTTTFQKKLEQAVSSCLTPLYGVKNRSQEQLRLLAKKRQKQQELFEADLISLAECKDKIAKIDEAESALLSQQKKCQSSPSLPPIGELFSPRYFDRLLLSSIIERITIDSDYITIQFYSWLS